MSKKTYTDDDIKDAVVSSVSFAQVIGKIGLHVSGGNYRTVKSHIKRLNLDISHFLGKSWNKGNIIGLDNGLKRELSVYLVENSTYTNGGYLKKRLIKEGYFKHKCYRCGRTTWFNEPIPLDIEHKNGIHTDNRIENLTLLCPNCHAQTPTYCGRNLKNVNSKIKERALETKQRDNVRKGESLKKLLEKYKKEKTIKNNERFYFFKGISVLDKNTIEEAKTLLGLSEYRIKKLYKEYLKVVR
jgi:5-methylcytosine-specific restriction endonuclease McrA